MTESKEPYSDQIFHRLLSIIHHTRQYGRQIIDENGLKPRDFSVLIFLSERGSATVGQVQAFVHKSPSTTSALIAQLEGNGYLTRTRSKEDNRVVIVKLTPLGQDIACKTPLGGLPLLRRQLGELSKKRLVQIDDVLTEIMNMMVSVETE
ncbi:MarR family winged helix-turn-helix transcriptional regulator [Chloroflexota bacterium]